MPKKDLNLVKHVIKGNRDIERNLRQESTARKQQKKINEIKQKCEHIRFQQEKEQKRQETEDPYMSLIRFARCCFHENPVP
jgi:hypothetical protein